MNGCAPAVQRAPRERGAPGRVPERRHRLRARGVVHGRVARRSRLVTASVGIRRARARRARGGLAGRPGDSGAVTILGNTAPGRGWTKSSDRFPKSLGEPLADSSAIPTWYLGRARRVEHVTVALSGDGGDEGFAGYDFRYMPHALEASVRRFVPGRSGAAPWPGLAARWPRSPRLPRPLRAGVVFSRNLGHVIQ